MKTSTQSMNSNARKIQIHIIKKLAKLLVDINKQLLT